MLALVFFGPAAAHADIVHLKTGRSLEGEVRPGSGEGIVEVRMGGGAVVRVKEQDILRIERKPSPMQLFDARFATVPEGEIEPLVELLVMAREKRLRRRAKSAARRILTVDPNHELARWTLGYVVFRNRWVLDAELRKKKDLVRVGGEWMTRQDQKLRQREEARREVEELLTLVESDNRRIRTYAVKELQRRVQRRDPLAVEVLGDRLADRRVAVRLIAVAGLGQFRLRGEAKRFGAVKVARQLHRLALEEKDPAVRQLLHGTERRLGTLSTFYPRENFRHALKSSESAVDTDEVERLAAVINTTVQKAWVPELCRAVAGAGGRPAVRLALRKTFGTDFGYDAAKWLRHWESRQDDFHDVK